MIKSIHTRIKHNFFFVGKSAVKQSPIWYTFGSIYQNLNYPVRYCSPKRLDSSPTDRDRKLLVNLFFEKVDKC